MTDNAIAELIVVIVGALMVSRMATSDGDLLAMEKCSICDSWKPVKRSCRDCRDKASPHYWLNIVKFKRVVFW